MMESYHTPLTPIICAECGKMPCKHFHPPSRECYCERCVYDRVTPKCPTCGNYIPLGGVDAAFR
mgnify:CR=1 FL=1